MATVASLDYFYSKPYQRHICCSLTFIDHQTWLRHRKVYHQSLPSSYVCSKCHTKYATISRVSVHYFSCRTPLGPQTQPLAEQCLHCGFSCSTAIGMGVHKRSKHPSEFDAEISSSLARSRAGWSVAELQLLARKESAWDGKGHINQYLSPLFPDRTTEALKGQRKSSRYQKILQQIRQGF